MNKVPSSLKIRRVLLSVTDKNELLPLAKAFSHSGAELVATGKTASVLIEAGLKITPIEEISGSPEAFQGRMKTLSFPVCSGILFRRNDDKDEEDLEKLKIKPIDAVVCNFYPFDQKLKNEGYPKSQAEARKWIELIDIGGPTLVRAAAKNAPDVLILTHPLQYKTVIEELETSGSVQRETVWECASQAWDMVSKYDEAISSVLGECKNQELRYGENPHQKAWLSVEPSSPVDWLCEDFTLPATLYEKQELSYNNILDCTHGFELMSELVSQFSDHQICIILKHGNPCGVSMIHSSEGGAQLLALENAWAGDPVSAFGGVVLLSHSIEMDSAKYLSGRFIEVLSCPGLSSSGNELKVLFEKRKKLKILPIRKWVSEQSLQKTIIPGAVLTQTRDCMTSFEELKTVTHKEFPSELTSCAQFGIFIAKSLKSNALSLVRKLKNYKDSYQLVGTGQGQPNRVEALSSLAIPRAQRVLSESSGKMSDVILVSDAFFPFRDTVDIASQSGIQYIVQPGGSIKDQESIDACDEKNVAMLMTGMRHFKH